MKRFELALSIVVILCMVFLAAWLGHHSPPVHAQSSGLCDQTVIVSAAAAASSTVFSAIPGQTVYVCAYDFSGDTASTTATWKSGTTSLSGAELSVANGHFQAGGGDGVIIQGITGSNLTIAAATGAIAGWVRAGQH